jgi:membrane associated rhomboid family serine protease
MFRSIKEDIKYQFATGNTITRLIIINVIVYVSVNIVYILSTHLNAGNTPAFYHKLIHYLSISSSYSEFFLRPWTWITSMFLHEGFWHILWNMLFLYWFGRIVGDLIGDRRILPIYILGGLVGAFAFLLSAQIFGYGGGSTLYALGASGAVMALVTSAGVIAPEYNMRLILIGDVKLKWIVAVLIFIDLIGTASDINTGGHFAHLGGVIIGWIYTNQLRAGNDIGYWIEGVVDWFKAVFEAKPKPARTKLKVVSRRGNKSKQDDGHQKHSENFQEELDRILEKIKHTGYDSLSDEERDFLYRASNKS